MFLFIIVFIVIIVTIFQSNSFLNNVNEIQNFKKTFPNSNDNYSLNYYNDTEIIIGIDSKIKTPIFNTIISSINNYISKNKGAVSDFHLIKDIVDRNCDSKENEIYSQIPVPIYLGLAGTMLGILTGVGSLVLTGAISGIINSTNTSNVGIGIDGINGLLGGVALAMISSILGIIFNIRGSRLAKEANSEVEKNKNIFLSWMQAELLPKLSTDPSGALIQMTNNLIQFNETFSENTREFKDTLTETQDVNNSQAKLYKSITELNINDIATANINVYDKLKNSTNEIGVFAEYLQKTNEYLKIIQSLSQNLGDYEKRTRVLEDAGAFFKRNENWLADNINTSNLKVKAALENFDEETQQYLNTLQDSLNQQILKFNGIITKQQEGLEKSLEKSAEIVAISLSKNHELFEEAIKLQQETFKNTIDNQQKTFENIIDNQQKLFESKFKESDAIISEIKSISHIKEGIKGFEKETKIQNDKIDALTKEIRNLAKSKSTQNWTPVKKENGNYKTNGAKKKTSWPKRVGKTLKKTFSKKEK